MLPSRLRRRVAALHSYILPLAESGPTVDAAMLLAAMPDACRDHEKLRFGYRSREGVATEREVEPHRLVHTGRRWYLAAWDGARNNWRTFRVDRIQGKISAGSRFAPRRPPEGGFAAYVARSVSFTPYPQRATILLRAPLEAAAQRIPSAAGMLEAVDEHTCLFHAGSCSFETLSVYLAWIGFEFEVREPPELVNCLRELADRFRKAASP